MRPNCQECGQQSNEPAIAHCRDSDRNLYLCAECAIRFVRVAPVRKLLLSIVTMPMGMIDAMEVQTALPLYDAAAESEARTEIHDDLDKRDEPSEPEHAAIVEGESEGEPGEAELETEPDAERPRKRRR